MANVDAGNSTYCDSIGVLRATSNLSVAYVVISSIAANAVLTLQDNAGTPVTKLTLKLAADASSEVFDFSVKPIVFPNGVKASTVTNCVATVVYA